MKGLDVGCFVKATSGRESGKLFIILRLDGEYVYLVDGKTRTLEKPKRKNKKHVTDAGFCNDNIRFVKDEDIKRAIRLYRREIDVKS